MTLKVTTTFTEEFDHSNHKEFNIPRIYKLITGTTVTQLQIQHEFK